MVRKVSVYPVLKCFWVYEPRYLKNFEVKEQITYRRCTLLGLGDVTVETGFCQSQFRIYETKFHLSVLSDA